MNRLTKFEKKIQKKMSSSYEPSLADSNRIYKEYCINEGRISEVLSDVYDWLAQEPICIDYKKGKIYMRCEATNSPDILCVHYFYINEEKNIKIEDFISDGDGDIIDSSIKSLTAMVKEAIQEEICIIEDKKKQYQYQY